MTSKKTNKPTLEELIELKREYDAKKRKDAIMWREELETKDHGDILIDDKVVVHGKTINRIAGGESVFELNSELHWEYFQDGTFTFELTTPSLHEVFRGKLYKRAEIRPFLIYMIHTTRGMVEFRVERNKKAIIFFQLGFKDGWRNYLGMIDPANLTKIQIKESEKHLAESPFSSNESYLPTSDEELIQNITRIDTRSRADVERDVKRKIKELKRKWKVKKDKELLKFFEKKNYTFPP
jgi:hypothetical protein